ncbi:MAG: ankyrin repeat domain-containing protein [Terracidiphilus sp.]
MKTRLLLSFSIALALVLFTGWWLNSPVLGSKPDAETLRTSLIAAVRADNTEEATRLIHLGANPNSRTSSKSWSVLHYAVRNGNVEVVDALLRAGADANYAGTIDGQAKDAIPLKPLAIAKAAEDLASQVPSTRMEATLSQGGLNDPALVKSLKDPKAADRYQKVIEALAKGDGKS